MHAVRAAGSAVRLGAHRDHGGLGVLVEGEGGEGVHDGVGGRLVAGNVHEGDVRDGVLELARVRHRVRERGAQSRPQRRAALRWRLAVHFLHHICIILTR